MPMMKAHIQHGFTAEQKAAALAGYTHAIQTAVTTPLQTVRVMLEELPKGNSCVAGVTDAELTIIEVFMMEGRTEQQKAKLIAMLTDATVGAFGVANDSVRVLLHDMPKINVGIGGHSAKSLGR